MRFLRQALLGVRGCDKAVLKGAGQTFAFLKIGIELQILEDQGHIHLGGWPGALG